MVSRGIRTLTIASTTVIMQSVVRARVAAGIEPALAICDTGRGDRVERGDALVARFEQRRPLVVPVPAGHTQAA